MVYFPWKRYIAGLLLMVVSWTWSVERNTILVSSACIGKFNSTEFDALHTIYSTLNGPNWVVRIGKPWNFTIPTVNPCNALWAFLLCNTKCRVKTLRLNNVPGMIGEVPNVFSSFPYLEELSIAQNPRVGGAMPTTISTLSHLLSLDLSNNLFSGSLSLTFTNLQKLRRLGLTSIGLTGPLPPEIWTLPSMEIFQIDGNYFTGTIPPEVDRMVNLTIFDISINFFTGKIPATVGAWRHLTQFSVAGNIFTGTIPEVIGNWKNLTSFDVTGNKLRGSIPASIANWTSIKSFILGANILTGTIPDIEYGRFSRIVGFDIDKNRLVGTLPVSFFDMVSLNKLIMARNQLSGSLSDKLLNMKKLTFLDIGKNNFTGTLPPIEFPNLLGLTLKINKFSGSIPSTIGNTSRDLREFYADFNQFTGTIPDNMWSLQALQLLNVAYNLLSGTIPDTINTTMPSLSVLEISANRFYGAFPEAVLTAPSLTSLDIHQNFFTGTIPHDIGNMSKSLIYADFSLNSFAGTLPKSITYIKTLTVFSVGHNELTGTIPCLLPLISLSYGFFYNNFFTGQIPAPFYFLKSFLGYNNMLTGTIPIQTGAMLRVFNIDNNFIIGTIPTNEQWWQRITVLSAGSNFLTGTLSTNVSSGVTLQFFDVSSNEMTGTIEDHFINHLALNKLYLQNNKFSGSIENVINPDVHHFLSSFDISNNAFTGTIPAKLFRLRRISEFAAVKNCMTGSIPTSICYANLTLSSLAIDGLYTADQCTDKIFRHIRKLDSYLLEHPLQGTIPACLFENFTFLTTLHVAGNGLEGNFLEKLTSISSKLVDLSLSHNKLTGTIPLVVQQHHWQNLDLSFNKFNGVLDETFYNFQSSTTTAPATTSTGGGLSSLSVVSSSSSSPSLYLDINRLSGEIPSALKNAQNINILSGNIFTCDINKNELPSHDPSKGAYECGSNSVNIAFYVWIAVISTLFIIVVIVLGLYNVCFRQHCFVTRNNNHEKQGMEDLYSDGCFVQIRSLVHSYWEVYELLKQIDPVHISVSGEFETSANHQPKIVGASDIITMQQHRFHTPVNEERTQRSKSTSTFNGKFQPTDKQANKAKAERENILAFQEVGLLLPTARRWSIWVTCILLTFGMIVYPILTQFYGRYSYSYAWVLGANFLTGSVPTVVIMSLLIILAFAIYSEIDLILFFSTLSSALRNRVNIRCFQSDLMKLKMIHDHWRLKDGTNLAGQQITPNTPLVEAKLSVDGNAAIPSIPVATSISIQGDHQEEKSMINKESIQEADNPGNGVAISIDSEVDENKASKDMKFQADNEDGLTSNRWKFKVTWYLVVGLVVSFDAVIVLAVNMLYVKIISDSNVNARGKQMIAIATSIYKLLWNSFIFKIFKMVRSQAKLTHYFPSASQTYQYEEEAFTKVLGSCMTALSLFNSIIAPCVAVALISSDCFLYVISSAPSIEVTYQSQPCRALLLQEQIPKQLECRGDVESYSTSFTPPFIYAYQCSSQLLVTFVEVFVYRYIIGGMLVPCIQVGLKFSQGYIYHQFGEDSFAWTLLSHFLMKALQPMPPASQPLPSKKSSDELEKNALIDGKQENVFRDSATQQIKRLDSVGQAPIPSKTLVLQKTLDKGWFRAERSIIYIATDMAIMLTFGTMFPPLALVGCISILVYTIFLQLALGRLYTLSKLDRDNFQSYVENIREEWKGMSKLIISAFHTMRPLVLIFWSFFLFDTLGDSYGTTKAAWIFLIMALIPFTIVLLNALVRRWRKYCEDRDRERKMSIYSHSIEMSGPESIATMSNSVGADTMTASLMGNNIQSEDRDSDEVGNPLVRGCPSEL